MGSLKNGRFSGRRRTNLSSTVLRGRAATVSRGAGGRTGKYGLELVRSEHVFSWETKPAQNALRLVATKLRGAFLSKTEAGRQRTGDGFHRILRPLHKPEEWGAHLLIPEAARAFLTKQKRGIASFPPPAKTLGSPP